MVPEILGRKKRAKKKPPHTGGFVSWVVWVDLARSGLELLGPGQA